MNEAEERYLAAERTYKTWADLGDPSPSDKKSDERKAMIQKRKEERDIALAEFNAASAAYGEFNRKNDEVERHSRLEATREKAALVRKESERAPSPKLRIESTRQPWIVHSLPKESEE